MKAAFLKNTGFFVLLLVCVLVSGPAFAQCEDSASATTAMNQIVQQDISNLNKFINQEWNFIDQDLSDTASVELVTRFEEFEENVFGWLNDWWVDRFLPAMKDSAKQLSVAEVDQTQKLGTLIDAKVSSEARNRINAMKVEARREYAPSDTTCQVDTVGVGQTKAYKMSRALNKSFSRKNTRRASNAAGTPAANGSASDRAARWDEYVNMFCDPDKGDQGCAAPGSMPGANTNISGFLWGDKQSIDMSVEENRIMVDAALSTLINPDVPDNVPPKVVSSSAGRQELLERRSKTGRMNTIYNVMGQMMGERAGGSGVNTQSMRTAGGSSAAASSTDASYREIADAMNRARYQNPSYMASIIQNPAQVVREQGAVNAVQLQLMNDIYKRMEEMTFMMAAEYSAKLDDQLPPNVSDKTKKR